MRVFINPLKKFREIKALAFDLDGTLLGPGAVLSERSVRAIHSCTEKGLRIIIATGRALEAAEKFRIPLEAAGPMVYFNGAIVADMPERKILHTTFLAPEIADFCADLSRETGVYYQVFISGTPENPGQFLLTEKEGPERDMYRDHTGIEAEIIDIKEALKKAGSHNQGCVKAMFLAEPEIQDTLRPRIEERYGKDVYIARTYRTFLEIMSSQVSKGRGLSLALQHLGIKLEETAVFGDEENDLPMFEAAGLSAAPANAKDSVRAAADLVIGSNAEDGVAAFLEETFLS